MSVDFITFCCPKDIRRLYVRGELEYRVNSHGFQFASTIVVMQRCANIAVSLEAFIKDDGNPLPTFRVRSEHHPNILSEFGIPENDPIADHWTHGPNAAHYWKWHVINHLIGLKVSTADYIVFSDCDCRIKSQPDSWVDKGIDLLRRFPKILIVSPSDGGHMAESMLPGGVRLTQNVSQQVFLCERERLKSIDFNVPWMKNPPNVVESDFHAPGGPFAEYYWLLEGRMWRHMDRNNLWRAILPERWRYWHDAWH